MSRRLTFVTGNAKKLEEIKAILGHGFPYKIESVKIDLPEVRILLKRAHKLIKQISLASRRNR